MKIKIKNDMFDISKRIKKIDKNYIIYYDNIKHNFELHNIAQRGSTYCLSLHYGSLDCRVLRDIHMSSVRHMYRNIDAMEYENILLDKDAQQQVLYDTEDRIKRCLYKKEVRV